MRRGFLVSRRVLIEYLSELCSRLHCWQGMLYGLPEEMAVEVRMTQNGHHSAVQQCLSAIDIANTKMLMHRVPSFVGGWWIVFVEWSVLGLDQTKGQESLQFMISQIWVLTSRELLQKWSSNLKIYKSRNLIVTLCSCWSFLKKEPNLSKCWAFSSSSHSG
jgi:hypothetical protein